VPPGTLDDHRRSAAQRVEGAHRGPGGATDGGGCGSASWGSWNAPHTGDVPPTDIIDRVLRARVGGCALEQANPRHEHEWHVWETVAQPEDRVLLPVVIGHAPNVVEHPELVAERLTRLARLVGPERVVASTDCGFAQGPFVRRVHPVIMWAKLESLVEGARLASAMLW